MGENKHIKELDAFAKKYVKEIPTETPSADFTSNLMHKIVQAKSVKSTTVYQPLISKKVLFFIVSAIIATLFIPFGNSSNGIQTLPKIDFSFLDTIKFVHVVENVNVSNTTFTITIIFGLFMAIQVFYLKSYFEKKIQGKL